MKEIQNLFLRLWRLDVLFWLEIILIIREIIKTEKMDFTFDKQELLDLFK